MFRFPQVSRLVNSKRTVSAGARQPSPIVVRQAYAGGAAGAATPPSVVNASAAAGPANQSNPISIIATPQSQQQQQQQQLHTIGEPLQQHGQQIISVSAAPTIVHATAAASNNNGTVGGNDNVGVTAAAGATPTGAAAAAGTFGGKYVLVQRAAHIGDIVTPRAASAPPTHNQVRLFQDCNLSICKSSNLVDQSHAWWHFL